MTYTLWSRGRLLGESPLDFARCLPKLRVGFLHPTPLGEKLLPVACGASPASISWGRAIRAAKIEGDEKAFTSLPECADYRSACDEEEAMALELRGPDGKMISTEDIAVRDTEWLLATFPEPEADAPEESLISEQQAETDQMVVRFEAAAAEEAAEARWRPPKEERPWMRCQLQVTLANEWSIP